ncbi:uncharacterized protein LOC134243154 [Saccostrea cucullata]|uniref:uncharacterized protein LOC134243154 n=1 Tax=Saccostrea cuccullata TaxID=36930 RepID=UPI002ED58CCA
MEYPCLLQTAACFLAAVAGQTFDNTGKEFVVAFFKALNLKNFDAYVLMASVNPENVNVTAIVRYDPHTFLKPSNLKLAPGNVEKLSLQEQYGPNQMAFPVLRINASHPVTVTAIVEGPNSAASYLVYPENVAGEVYRMMPFCNKTVDGLCICVIITLKENTSIMLENKNNGNISVYTEQHAVGEETIDSLLMPNDKRNLMYENKHSYISLESRDDFTGLLMQANNPVVVFCGGRKDDATMSMEQILPIDYFGQSFYSFPFDHNAMATPKLRFIAHHNCTTISVDYEDSWKIHAGDTLELSMNKSSPFNFSANKPVALIQIFSGPNPSGRDPNNYEEGLLLIPALGRYLNSVVIPRRQGKDKSANSKMRVGLVSDVHYNFQTQGGNTSLKTVSRGIVRESDNDGRLLKLAQQGYTKGNTFSAYTYRPAGNDGSFSVVGFKFFKRKNDNRRYSSETYSNTEDEEIDDPIDTEITTLTPDIQSSTTEASQTYTEESTTEDNNVETSTETNTDTSSDKITQGTTSTEHTNLQHVQYVCPPCQSKPKAETSIQTEEEIKEKIEKIKKALIINKHDLSSYRRKKISADDTRSSAKGIGLLGAFILCAFVSFIIIMDFKTLAHQSSVLWRKIFGPNTCAFRDRLRKLRKP